MGEIDLFERVAEVLVSKSWPSLYRVCAAARLSVCGQAASEGEEAQARELLRLILPMARGYAHSSNVGSNLQYVQMAETFLAAPTPRDANHIAIPCNLPFERVPQHQYDPGFGPVPPRPKVEPLHPDNIPLEPPAPPPSGVSEQELVEQIATDFYIEFNTVCRGDDTLPHDVAKWVLKWRKQ